MEEIKKFVSAPMPIEALVSKAKVSDSSTPTYLLLHGFGERAKRLYRQWGAFFSDDVNVVIPNAPFPLPKKVIDTNSQTAYYQIPRAWYFYDDIKDEFLIDYDFPANLLADFIQQLGLKENPLCIIGYSQGGYLAPFVGQKLKKTKHVIGVNCRFREDLLGENIHFRCDAFHAKNDEMVDPKRSYQSFEKLRKRINAGDFYHWPNKAHALDSDTNKELNLFLKKHRALLA